ncbi:hypothetical protein [Micromonospora sp. HUAS LYJ1]|uniref:hypothetical protein n=1 Tax=Micromonospora sp. HUAS LYJ1 TaxID=3061626 RepID=UPI0026713146|nr:hypothetical protein [Micromonospora sp. HUAS LYJ1]WKU07989.1 hypothetical protein Q2K16_13650 [Micromonospora sp. HUAS LYJ1]
MTTTTKTVSPTAQFAAARAFNDEFPVGTPVRYWKGIRDGDGRTARTRTQAQLLSGHTAVVWLDGVSGCIALTHIQPISEDELMPEQPDGIEDDSYDLPDPHRAAGRVRDWISAWGDGLIDTADGHPLYARDLEAICRAVLATPADTIPGRPHRDEPPLDRDGVDVHLPANDIPA